MVAIPGFTRVVHVVVLITFVSACSTTRPLSVDDPESLASQVSVGDRIDVKRKDSSRVKFRVTEVSPDALFGENVIVPYTNIEQVTVSEQNASAAGVVFLVLLGAAVVWMVKEGVDCGGLFNPCLDEY